MEAVTIYVILLAIPSKFLWDRIQIGFCCLKLRDTLSVQAEVHAGSKRNDCSRSGCLMKLSNWHCSILNPETKAYNLGGLSHSTAIATIEIVWGVYPTVPIGNFGRGRPIEPINGEFSKYLRKIKPMTMAIRNPEELSGSRLKPRSIITIETWNCRYMSSGPSSPCPNFLCIHRCNLLLICRRDLEDAAGQL